MAALAASAAPRRVARWVVLKGVVEQRHPMGPWVRLTLVGETSRTWYSFQADVRPEEAPAPRTRVRFGFDSAHVVREPD